jgi:hypothetical protein
LDYNIYIEEALHAHLVAQLAFVPAAALAGLALTVLQRSKLIGQSMKIISLNKQIFSVSFGFEECIFFIFQVCRSFFRLLLPCV